MKPLHEELKEIRLDKNISLEQIHEATKIYLDFLIKIEDGDFSIVPEPFLRAFLREYAEVVGIDPVRVIQRFENKADKIMESMPKAIREKVPDDRVAADRDSGKLSQHEPAVSEEASTPVPEPQSDGTKPDHTAAGIEPTLPVDNTQELQPSLFDQAPIPEDAGLPTGSDSPLPPSEPAPITVDETSRKASLPREYQRLDIEEPRQTNVTYIVVFVIIIIIAAAIIFYINKGS